VQRRNGERLGNDTRSHVDDARRTCQLYRRRSPCQSSHHLLISLYSPRCILLFSIARSTPCRPRPSRQRRSSTRCSAALRCALSTGTMRRTEQPIQTHFYRYALFPFIHILLLHGARSSMPLQFIKIVYHLALLYQYIDMFHRAPSRLCVLLQNHPSETVSYLKSRPANALACPLAVACLAALPLWHQAEHCTETHMSTPITILPHKDAHTSTYTCAHC
jgi:hypothetical protein